MYPDGRFCPTKQPMYNTEFYFLLLLYNIQVCDCSIVKGFYGSWHLQHRVKVRECLSAGLQFNCIWKTFLGDMVSRHYIALIYLICECVCVSSSPPHPGLRKNRKNTSRHFFLITVATADVVVLTLYGPVAWLDKLQTHDSMTRQHHIHTVCKVLCACPQHLTAAWLCTFSSTGRQGAHGSVTQIYSTLVSVLWYLNGLKCPISHEIS